MLVWNVDFQVYQPIPGLPVPGRIENQIEYDKSYVSRGLIRKPVIGIFLYTLSGKGMFKSGEKEFILSPETASICEFNPDVVYFYPEIYHEPWNFLWMSFHGEMALEMVKKLTQRYGPVYTLSLKNEIIKRLLAYRGYRKTLQTLKPVSGAGLVMDLLVSLGNSAEAIPPDSSSKHELIAKVQSLISDELEVGINITEIARRLKVSREHLCRVFKEQLEISPVDYLLRRKMLLACQLLRESELSCKEIATRLGYGSQTNFSRAFQQAVGLSPSQFRLTGGFPLF
jgi:AraC-like DNA-binding protein